MIEKKYQGKMWLEFEILSEEKLNHGVLILETAVQDGKAMQDFESEGFPVGAEHSQKVKAAEAGKPSGSKDCVDLPSRAAVSRIIGDFNLETGVFARQIHGKEVARIYSIGENPTCDALTTDIQGLSLIIRHADCQAGILYDPVNHAVANVHSGWRGSVQNIYAETISHMQKHYGTHPEDLLVAISPSLGPQSAEFINYRQELPESFWEFQVKENVFDFWAISRWQLAERGVLPHHIQVAEIDTYLSEQFFSYRRDKTERRNLTFVELTHRF